MTEQYLPCVDELRGYNAAQAVGFSDTDLQVTPLRQLAIVTCMDSRIDTFKVLGLGNGEAHIIRNAGGVITDDMIRSLCLSQRHLGTREIILVHHTDCGLQQVTEDGFRDELQAEVGEKPSWMVEAFADPYVDVRKSIERLLSTPFLPYKDHISGFVYDVTDGLLHPVT